MNKFCRLASLSGFLLLAACGTSPPTQFYTLTPVPGVPVQSASGIPIMPVVIGRLDIPETLDRHELVRKNSATRLDVDDREWWGGPLDAMARAVLEQDLAARLPQGTIGAAVTAGKNDRTLKISVTTFMPEPGGDTLLEADWSLSDEGNVSFTHHTRVSVAGGAGGGSDQAMAMSRALGLFADRIAAFLAEAGNPGTSGSD